MVFPVPNDSFSKMSTVLRGSLQLGESCLPLNSPDRLRVVIHPKEFAQTGHLALWMELQVLKTQPKNLFGVLLVVLPPSGRVLKVVTKREAAVHKKLEEILEGPRIVRKLPCRELARKTVLCAVLVERHHGILWISRTVNDLRFGVKLPPRQQANRRVHLKKAAIPRGLQGRVKADLLGPGIVASLEALRDGFASGVHALKDAQDPLCTTFGVCADKNVGGQGVKACTELLYILFSDKGRVSHAKNIVVFETVLCANLIAERMREQLRENVHLLGFQMGPVTSKTNGRSI